MIKTSKPNFKFYKSQNISVTKRPRSSCFNRFNEGIGQNSLAKISYNVPSVAVVALGCEYYMSEKEKGSQMFFMLNKWQ